MKITIQDVAKKAEVSVATVSRVLNGNYPVKAETKEKVQKVIKELNLTNIKTVNSRIEDYQEETFDIVTSRAVAKTNILLELSCRLSKINGYFIFLKANIEDELEESTNAIKQLNLTIEKKETFNLPIENSQRTILKIKKNTSIPLKYPRNFAKIKKNPL